jgi:anti-sigma factor RsiW
MNCRHSESLILAERDGVLTKTQHAGLSDHIAACAPCRQFRAKLDAALDSFKASASATPVPDADEAWRELRAKLKGTETKAPRKRPLAPVFWFGAPLAAAAALALAFFVSRPVAPPPSTEPAVASQPYDPSIIAGADYVEAGDPNAATMVYVDKDSGWLVVWATDSEAETRG